jgi:cytochrome c peroxidase
MAVCDRLLTGLIATLGLLAGTAQAQQTAFGELPVPAGNPLTPAKIALGKALFWDEQLSLTGTVACGTCHRPQAAGTDPRSALEGNAARHPGPDGVLGNADDSIGSPGVPAHDVLGNYQPDTLFGLQPRVGRRKAGTVVNAAFAGMLFWDGRADSYFRDPLTNQVLLPNYATLENQALGPLVNTSEMGHSGVTLSSLSARLAQLRPLALASDIPPALSEQIGTRTYPELFADAFGSAEITPARLVMAIASYERTLIADQAPLDAYLAGTPSLTALELQGQQVFQTSDCTFCHSGPLFTDGRFHYIGVRPPAEDIGRGAFDSDAAMLGAMLTPGLRGLGERAPFMHNGRLATLEDVVEFYNRGGDFSAPNKDPRVRPRNWTEAQKAALLAFMRRPLTDPRVAAELPPFDRPTLFSESQHVPQISGVGRPGSDGSVPQLTALEPPLLGNANFTVVVSQALGGAQGVLVLSNEDPGLPLTVPSGAVANVAFTLDGNGAATGQASVQLDLSSAGLTAGQTLWARAYVSDPAAAGGIAVTPAVSFTIFGQLPEAIFAAGFE